MRYPVTAVALIFVFAGCIPDLSPGPVPAADRSPTAKELVARGMPAPERVWTGADYLAAMAVLDALANKDATTLPRLDSPASGPVFARMVDEENIASVDAEPLELNEKMQHHIGVLTGSTKLLSIYAAQARPRATFDAELVALSAYVLASTERLMVVTRAVVKSIPPGDPTAAKRLAGFETMRGGLGTIVGGCLTTLTEKRLYRPEVRVRLAQSLARHLPAIYGDLVPSAQQEITSRLATLIAQESNAPLREAEKAIQASLERDN